MTNKHNLDDYQQYIMLSKYARFLDNENRRETWEEVVGRWIDFFSTKCTDINIPFNILRDNILDFNILPSMRGVMTAGKALDRDEAAVYNCWATSVDHPRVFDEIFYLLMLGGGVGFSVERQFIVKMPEVAEKIYDSDTIISVKDSKIGWCTALRELISLLYAGKIAKWDTSKVRPEGARLKVFGGRSSGKIPLEKLFGEIISIFKKAEGRKLTSLECHDIICHIANTVVAGGVRRSACISLSNLSDIRMKGAKLGQWQTENNQRSNANNSVIYTEKPDFSVFIEEWKTLFDSKCGERGIVNRVAFQNKCKEIGRDYEHDFIINPCGEVILRPSGQACNLSEVVIRPNDNFQTLNEKVKLATIIGTMQSTLTNFRYLRKVWRHNCEEERLLGVSLTGIMDHKVMCNPHGELKKWLTSLRDTVKKTNMKWADKLGIAHSKAMTCIKPSGNISQLVNCSSGIHPRYSKYYIRTVMSNKEDTLTRFMIEQGVPHKKKDMTYYFQFPIESPNESTVESKVGAMRQLELWKVYSKFWCDHNPSQTIYYRDSDFLQIGQWIWDNFNEIGGLSFFPKADHIYENAPYTEISKEEYDKLNKEFPKINWDLFREEDDNTSISGEAACSAGNCEV